MVTFIICLLLLVVAYFTYGKYLENLCGVDRSRVVPSASSFDGVDYIPMPRWRVFLIQLLNIAGLGPIFGAVLGAAYGPVAFLWITLGGIFMGAFHDFIAGFISLRSNGASLPEIIGEWLGAPSRFVMRIFSVLLLVLVGAVFLSQPATLIANRIDAPSLDVIAFGSFSWLLLIVLGVILIYYVLATLLPIDKVIGKVYPIFGLMLLVMAFGILMVLLFSGDYTIPELTSLKNHIADPNKFPIMPMMFTTIACGAISGFHATQSPMMARCIKSEGESRMVFYGAMIAESIIALIWAAIAMSFWGGVEQLNSAIAENGGSAAILVDIIATTTLGKVIASIVIFGTVACAITSGDTAFRSARLILADILRFEQKSLSNRLLLSIPLFICSVAIILFLPFNTIWSYFAWSNQTLAVFTLWLIFIYLYKNGKNIVIAVIPALIMTYVCCSYIFISPLMFGMENRLLAYSLGGVATVIISIAAIRKAQSK